MNKPFNSKTGVLERGASGNMVMWLLDADYDACGTELLKVINLE